EMILPSLMTYPFLLEVSFGELFPTGYVIFLLESPQTPLSSITHNDNGYQITPCDARDFIFTITCR
ncbi:hypothetical protein JWJ90_21980, partial [Desulfobulbus rhabdoformis]|uniref:hypothetical protein n=1 Tax=Desulfobulbus rhabdoformis TaxID=34032 RepID=UPI0019659241